MKLLRFIDEFEQKYSTPIISEAIEKRKTPKIKIEHEPETWWEYVELAQQANKNNDLETAEKYYRKAIEIDPNRAEHYYQIGVLLFDNKKRWREAESLFKKAIEIDPRNAIKVNSFGFLRYLQKRYDEAIALFEQTIDLDHKLAFPYINLSAIYKLKSEKENNVKDELKANNYAEEAKNCLKPIDYYLWACLHSAKRDKEETFKFLKVALELEPEKKIFARCSPTFDWIRDDDRFWEIVGRDDE